MLVAMAVYWHCTKRKFYLKSEAYQILAQTGSKECCWGRSGICNRNTAAFAVCLITVAGQLLYQGTLGERQDRLVQIIWLQVVLEQDQVCECISAESHTNKLLRVFF